MRGGINRGWTRVPHLQESEARDMDIHVISDAEYYLLVGKDVRRRLRRGRRAESISRSHQLPAADTLAAQRFAESSSAFVLRALVEEWPWPQIKCGLLEQDATAVCLQFHCRHSR